MPMNFIKILSFNYLVNANKGMLNKTFNLIFLINAINQTIAIKSKINSKL